MFKREVAAHFRERPGEPPEFQDLEEHLNETASRAERFAERFKSGLWGDLLGKWHDLGKASPSWQDYLYSQANTNSGASSDQGYEGEKGMHSTAGAVLAQSKACDPERDCRSRLLAYAIAGHHAGLPDWEREENCGYSLRQRLWNDAGELRTQDLDGLGTLSGIQHFLTLPLPETPPPLLRDRQEEHYHLWLRMLFSCLVDADFLDTEAFMEPEKGALRGGYSTLEELKKRLDTFMEQKQTLAPNTPLNNRRRKILESCRHKAQESPGFFTLTVPTGGGKTLASMAFALDHALSHNKRRVIVAIPYTSIIEQTAKVFKFGTDNAEEIRNIKENGGGLFGEDNVLEHHSNLDPEAETTRSRLAAENWDAPIIVTTNVQLFESLFSARPSRCRKLHNIADSVIILDEPQMLPPEYLKPILSALRGLVAHFGVTVLFCTATQPALSGTIGSGQARFTGLPKCREIVDDPHALSEDLCRVTWQLPADFKARKSWADLANELQCHEKVLCIVNTRKDCRDLHDLMPKGTIHLSALMCGEERSEVISDIKKKLLLKEPIRVISTQLVEAGVDIDFPVVYRALGGIDSLAQAAGRSNREGLLDSGLVVLFIPPRQAPSGLLRKGEDAAKELLDGTENVSFTPDLYRRYFQAFYRRVNTFDRPDFYGRLVKEAPDWHFQFRTFDRNFRLIDDSAQKGIIVRYCGSSRDSNQLIEELRRLGPSRQRLRALQRFTVNVPEYTFQTIWNAGYLEEIHGYIVQAGSGLYRPGLGLLPDRKDWLQEFLYC